MAELEHDLRSLATLLEFPAERDLWPGVEARLAARPRSPWLRAAVAVVVAAALGIGIAFAVPPARSAILRFLGLEGVSIVRVDKLPPADAHPAVIGVPTTLAGAEKALGFKPLLPKIGAPDAVYLDPSRVAVLIVYGKPLRLRLEETRLGVFQKMVGVRARVDQVTVNGDPGVWLTGLHVFEDFFSQPRLAGNTLLWEHDRITYRLDGHVTKDEALRIARSVPPR
jgi:hypothetical protein